MLCSGRVYYDLEGHEKREQAESVAIARVELLYPFARDQLSELIASYPNLKEVVWAQEEPKNMGAWSVDVAPAARSSLPEGVELCYVGRPQRASPSEGYPVAHRKRAGADRADGADLGERDAADHRDGERLAALGTGANPAPGAMLVADRAAVLALEPNQTPHRLPRGRTACGHVSGCDGRCCHATNLARVAGHFLWTWVQTLDPELVREGHGLVPTGIRGVALTSGR